MIELLASASARKIGIQQPIYVQGILTYARHAKGYPPAAGLSEQILFNSCDTLVPFQAILYVGDSGFVPLSPSYQ